MKKRGEVENKIEIAEEYRRQKGMLLGVLRQEGDRKTEGSYGKKRGSELRTVFECFETGGRREDRGKLWV